MSESTGRGFAYLDNTYCLGEVLTATVTLDAGATARGHTVLTHRAW
ncbi:MAG: hypothetical protein IPL33_13020 [Sphingobacteriales bacterium]|nr:hypothetical protein [Sphingobacteriales bacterium]